MRGKGFQASGFRFASGVLLLCFLLVLVSFEVRGQALSAKAGTEKQEHLIGDRIEVKVELEAPENYNISVPGRLPPMQGLEALDTTGVDSSHRNGSLHYTQHFFLSAYDSGRFIFPAIPYTFRKKGDTSRFIISTDPLVLKISRLEVDTTKEIKPIKGPVQLGPEVSDWLPWVLGVLAMAGLAALLYYFLIKRRRGPVKTVEPVVKETPYEAALRQLERLQKEKIWREKGNKVYYTELSNILREYLSAVYEIDAMEFTTSEIITTLKGRLSTDGLNRLQNILSMADLVKFARHVPDEKENEEMVKEAISVISS